MVELRRKTLCEHYTQAYSAKKMKEAMEHSANMQKEKERIIQEARERDDKKKINNANYENQKIYEQDQ